MTSPTLLGPLPCHPQSPAASYPLVLPDPSPSSHLLKCMVRILVAEVQHYVALALLVPRLNPHLHTVGRSMSSYNMTRTCIASPPIPISQLQRACKHVVWGTHTVPRSALNVNLL